MALPFLFYFSLNQDDIYNSNKVYILYSLCEFSLFCSAYAQEVGCDYNLNTGTEFDRCKVCGGDGSSCALNVVNYTKIHLKSGKEIIGAFIIGFLRSYTLTRKYRMTSWLHRLYQINFKIYQ